MKRYWRQGSLYLLIMGMEGCWLYALLALLNQKVTGGQLSLFGIILLYPVSFAVNRLIQRLRWWEIAILTISWLAWAGAMLLTVKVQLFGSLPFSDKTWLLAVPRSIPAVIYGFKPELLLLLSTGVAWWLGRRLSYLKGGFNILVAEFQFGLVILAIALLVARELGVELAGSVPLVLAFFMFALLGISIAHALEGTSWLSGFYKGHWSGLLLVSIGLVLLGGVFITMVVTPDLLGLFIKAIKWVWGLVIMAMEFFARLLPEPGPAQLPPSPATPLPGTEEPFEIWTIPEAVRSALRIGWTVLVSGILIFALWRVSSDIFRWLRRRMAVMSGTELEPMPGAFRADLLNLLKRILSRLMGLRFLLRPRTKVESPPEVISVRHVYRQLLRWAASAGYPRQFSQTPHEYFYALAGLLPESSGDLDFITSQYVRTRYGAMAPSDVELHRLKQSWHNVKQNHLKNRRNING